MPKKINVKGPIVSDDTAWLYHYFGWNAASPATVAQGLEDAGGEDVVIEINSPGGVCVYGYEMYTAIMEYTGKVTVHVISAMSAATLLVCAADEALISDTGIFMIHNARSQAAGDYRNMQMEADALREFNAGIINAYVRKTKKSREEIQALMDNDSYMSPKTAIEQGFIDGYMFGDPEESEGNPESLAENIVAAEIPVIPEDKAKELIQLLKNGEGAAVALADNVDNGGSADPNRNDMKGEDEMDLEEFLAQNPQARATVDEMTANAREEGAKAERERIQSLDAIASTVTPEALHNAKYGENPMDGPALAYQAMLDGERAAGAYMERAKSDAADAGVNDVGVGAPDGEAETDESDAMAAYVNRGKGGK